MTKYERTEINCTCGSLASKINGNRSFTISDKLINLKNIDYFYCEFCGAVTFDSTSNVDFVLKYTYKENLSEVDCINLEFLRGEL
jgi:YgiT-type zinc finger domain-containing protein